jgi:hypothetical protein
MRRLLENALFTAVSGICLWIIAGMILLCMSFATRGQEQPAPAMLQSGKTMWGDLTVAGPTILITGGESWTAQGRILPNGEIHVHWLQIANDRPAFGIYQFKDGAITGRWGWGENIMLNQDGTFSGLEHLETIQVKTGPAGPDL